LKGGGFGRSRVMALALAGASIVGGAGWLRWNAVHRAEINFLPAHAPAQWIVYPLAADSTLHLNVEVGTAFKRTFTLEQPQEQAVLRVAGCHRYTLTVNG
jgi:hypothetical protein